MCIRDSFYCVIAVYFNMGVISATLKIVLLISPNLFFLLYKADPTPDPPSKGQILDTSLEGNEWLQISTKSNMDLKVYDNKRMKSDCC